MNVLATPQSVEDGPAAFARLSDVLLHHLPRPAAGGGVSVTSHNVTVAPPGVSVADIAALLSDLAGGAAILPADMPLRELRLAALELRRVPITNQVTLEAELAFAAADPVELAPGVALRLATLAVRYRSGRFTATAAATVTVDGYGLAAAVDMPAGIVRARVEPSDPGAALLVDRGLVAPGGGHVLRSLKVQAHIPLRRVVAHVALDHPFAIGPVRVVSAEGEINLGGAASAELAAAIEVDLDGHPPLEIAVAADVDGHGWLVAGAVDLPAHAATLGHLVTAAAVALSAPSPRLPDRIAQTALRHVAVAADSRAGTFRLVVGLAWSDGGALLVTLEGAEGHLSLRGELQVGEAVLDLAFDHGPTAMVAASWRNAGARGLDLGDIVAALGGGASFPSGGAQVAARAIGVASTGSDLLAVAEIDGGIDLSRLGELPLLGALMPSDAAIGLKLYPHYLSDGLDGDDQAQARGLLAGIGKLPGSLSPGFSLVAELQLGALSQVLDPGEVGAPDPAPPPPAAASATHRDGDAPLAWTDIDRKIGPLHLQRAGYAMTKDATGGSELNLALDAELSVAGLSLGLAGLGASYNFGTRVVTPHLSGLGLDLKRGPVEAGAAFLNLDGDFAGEVTIRAETFALSAIGAFKMIDSTPSIFGFGTLDTPLGGPVFLFVEGLAAGLGIHRSLHMPDIDRIAEFPLVADANAIAAGQAVERDPMAKLRSLHDHVRPQLGQYFLAAGVKFNSFRLLHGNVVVVAQFGRRFEVDLVGTASFATPPDLPAGVPAMASVALAVEARFDPAEGTLKVDGRLDPRSYVYSPLCHLSGGFAYHAWFKGEHAGDFVLSIGGYNRYWTKPAHYPAVPRVELSFRVSSAVLLKGDAYFALTPSVAMAGGSLHAQVDDGSLHAWADLSVDFLVGWEPFHYDARIHIAIGARWKCFHTHASADLHVWGPSFSGTAQVDWFIFSFEIAFGSDRPNVPLPISFARFKSAFLGVEAGEDGSVLGITVVRGQTGRLGDALVVDPAGLELALSTRVPGDHSALGDADAVPTGADPIGLPPLWGVPTGASTLRVRVSRDGADVSTEFVAEAEDNVFPAALWAPVRVPLPDTPSVRATGGLRLRHGVLTEPEGSARKQAREFRYPAVIPAVVLTASNPVPPRPRPDPAGVWRDLAALGLDLGGLRDEITPVLEVQA